MTAEQFRQRCAKQGLHLTDRQMEQFQTYLKLLQEWNEKMNLTAITDEEGIWEKHFYDSLLPFFHMDLTSLADVGTGAGFPGIPCKIAWPHIQLVLVEPLQKRCRFLQAVTEALHLNDVAIENIRAEDFAKTSRGRFAMVTSRAVARLSILLELCAPLARTGGLVVALKGPHADAELAQARKAMEVLHMKLAEKEVLEENGAVRVNLVFEKEADTPARYPRAFGQIKKHPLEAE